MAVVLIVASALLIPWYLTERLQDELNVRVAEQMAITAESRIIDLANEDWIAGRTLLEAQWSGIASQGGLPNVLPRLIKADGDNAQDPTLDEFEKRSLKEMSFAASAGDPAGSEAVPSNRKPESAKDKTSRIEFDEDGNRFYRYAMAVRRSAVPTEEKAARGALIGIVSVNLPEQDRSRRGWYRMVVLGAGVMAGILAMLVFYLITQFLILSPVRRLRRVAERVSLGEVAIQAELPTGDEFEELADAFNQMLANLHSSHEELRKINRSLDVRLGELAETNVALYESNRLKSEFLANVSHELRTPLTSIIGFAELILDKPDQDERVLRFCNHIHSNGKMLLELINDLLDLAKIEAGKMEIRRTHFRVGEVCEALADFIRPLVDKKQLDIEWSIGQDVPEMYSDAGKVQQVLYNLLSNAIKFTPELGKITIQVEQAGEKMIQICVIDTGPGIAAEQQKLIFEKFNQVDASVTREHGGTGLGLAISRELVQILGGTISVQSEPGLGAEFTIRLPIESPERAERMLPSLT
jgi:signal transduction histidine kinase